MHHNGESSFRCHYSLAPGKCGSLGAEATNVFCVYANQKLSIHKIKYNGCKNWIQMENCGYLKTATSKTVVDEGLL
jgi:hypothetical protein